MSKRFIKSIKDVDSNLRYGLPELAYHKILELDLHQYFFHNKLKS